MEQIIDQCVVLTLSKQSPQQGPTDEMIPCNKGKSIVASMDAAPAITEVSVLAKKALPHPHWKQMPRSANNAIRG